MSERERAASELANTLNLFGRYENVQKNGDRITYMLHDETAVTLVVVDARAVTGTSNGCPFCGSTRAPLVRPADETFMEQRGCLDCNGWWEPPLLKRP